MIGLPPTDCFLMIERLDCISILRELPSIAYLRARPLAAHLALQHTIRVSLLFPPFLPFTDQDSLSTRKRPMDFPRPISAVCAAVLVPTAFLSAADLGTTADCYAPCVYNYVTFGGHSMENIFVTWISSLACFLISFIPRNGTIVVSFGLVSSCVFFFIVTGVDYLWSRV